MTLLENIGWVSLQKYNDHRSLCDVFHMAPLHADVPQNRSIFTHFKRLYYHGTNFEGVLLMYVSPKETKEITPILSKLQQEIAELNIYINVYIVQYYQKIQHFMTPLRAKTIFHVTCNNMKHHAVLSENSTFLLSVQM